ncbi:MAG: Cna B-type domain-containing protein, partial [Acholeplasmatales bacterium]|nr:Cna B-type domain-containing protein [Acholeplasmatales bacterium]
GTFELSELLGWHTTIVSFNISYMKPVSDLVVISNENPYGVDTANQYRYEITGSLKEGYVLNLYHTPENAFEVSGTVEWVDEDDTNGVRPDSVSVNLYADGELKETVIATSATGWTWAFTGYPKYADGSLIDYEVKQTPVDDYYVSSYETTIINYYLDYVSYIRGYLEWVDNNDDTGIRPDKVSISLVTNDNVVLDTVEVEEKTDESDEENICTIWQYTFFTENLDLTNVESLTLVLNDATGYIYKVSDDITGISLYVEGYQDIMNAVSLINAIGEVEYTEESYSLIKAARAAYDGLDDAVKQDQVSNYSTLVAAEKAYSLFVAQNRAINDVIDIIDSIGKISYTKSCIGLIEDARLAYESLADELKNSVTNYNTLCVAEETYDALGSLVYEVGNVYILIERIGNVEKTDECYARITAARAAYDNLTSDLQAMVNNYETLLNAEGAYSHTHSFTYTANGNSIIAVCSNDYCDISDGLSLTLIAPSNLEYDGKAKAVSFEDGYNEELYSNPTITYYKDGNQVDECVEAGTYTASVTVDGATASLTFEIAAAEASNSSSNNGLSVGIVILIAVISIAFGAGVPLVIFASKRRK